MSKNDKRKQRIEQSARDALQKMGPKNPNWRNTFFRFWQEVKTLQARVVANKQKISIYDKQLKDSEKLDEKEEYKFAIASVSIKNEVDEVQLSMAQDELLKLLGKEWTVKSVWKELEEFKTMTVLAFEESERGEHDSRGSS